MRRLLLPLVALLVLPLLGSDSPKENEDAAVLQDGLEGSWEIVLYETGGKVQKMPPGMVLTYRDGKVAWWPPTGKGPNVVMATYRADPTTRPARIDQVDTGGIHKGRAWKYIYRIDGDTLRIAYKMEKGEPPRNFDDKASLHIEIYQRVKK